MAEKKDRIEQLLKQAETTSNKALKNAIEKHAVNEQLLEEERLLQQFKRASETLQNQVDNLVNVRKEEKRIREQVKIVDAALEKFKSTGDFDAFICGCKKVGVYTY